MKKIYKEAPANMSIDKLKDWGRENQYSGFLKQEENILLMEKGELKQYPAPFHVTDGYCCFFEMYNDKLVVTHYDQGKKEETLQRVSAGTSTIIKRELGHNDPWVEATLHPWRERFQQYWSMVEGVDWERIEL